jgi:hypothetical protein
MLVHLLRYRLRSFVNGFRQGEPAKKKRRWLSIAAPLVFSAWMFNEVRMLFASIILVPEQGPIMMANFLITSFTGMFAFLLFSGVPVILHFFFMSKDLSLLLPAPIHGRVLSRFKFIEATCANSAIFIYLGLPYLLAIGVALNAGVWYYLLAIVSAVFFLIIPTGIGTLISLPLVRLLPVKRAKNLAVAAMGVIFILTWVGFQFIRMSRLNPMSSDFDPTTWDKISGMASRSIIPLLPSTWIAETWISLAQEHYLNAAPGMALLFTLALALLFGVSFLLEWAYSRDALRSWAKGHYFQRTVGGKVKIRSGNSQSGQVLLLIYCRHNFRLLMRDPRQLTNLLLFLAMMIVLPLTAQADAKTMGAIWGDYYPYLFVLLFASLMAGSLSARLFPMEGISFSYPKIAPQPMWQLVTAKMLSSVILCVPFMMLAIVILAFKASSSAETVTSVFCAVLCAIVGAAGMGGVFGAMFAKFDWDNPKQMLQNGGNLMLSLSLMIEAALGAFLFVMGRLIANPFVGLIFIAGYSIALIFLGTHLASRRLDKLEWIY